MGTNTMRRLRQARTNVHEHVPVAPFDYLDISILHALCTRFFFCCGPCLPFPNPIFLHWLGSVSRVSRGRLRQQDVAGRNGSKCLQRVRVLRGTTKQNPSFFGGFIGSYEPCVQRALQRSYVPTLGFHLVSIVPIGGRKRKVAILDIL